MLQLARIQRPVLDEVLASTPRTGDVARDVDHALATLRARRHEAARGRGMLWSLAERIDAAIRTSEPEYLDRDDVPEATKLKIVRALHRFNLSMGLYGKMLEPLLAHVGELRGVLGRTPRVLEIASGAGELAMELARRVRDEKLDVEVVGSDIVAAQVQHAANEAARRDLPVKFIQLDATAMDSLSAGAFDVVYIAQTMHHFSPAMLARIIASAARVATSAFIGVDGYRSLFKLLFIPGPTWLVPWTAHFHDAFISARKFYPEAELALIARIAAPGHDVKLGRAGMYSVLTVAH